MENNFPIHENVVTIPLNLIKITDDRYRKDMGDIASLAESIKEKGQLIPIIVTTDFTLIAGERRYRAHQLLKMETINTLIRTQDTIDNKITEILENLDRKEFTWQEQVKAIEDLHKLFAATNPNWSGRKTAVKAGLSSGGVSTDLGLAKALEEDPEMFKHCKTRESALKVLKQYNIDELMAEVKLRKSRTNYGKKAQNYVFHGNAINLIDELPAGNINAVISDPFYGMDINKVKKHDGTKKLDIYEDDEKLYFNTMSNIVPKLSRVLNDNAAVVIFCKIQNFYWLHDLLTKHGIKCDPVPGIWDRGTGQTMQPNTHMASAYEVFVYGFKGEAVFVKPGQSNVLRYSGIPPVYKEHPVQKPLALMEDLISRFCLPGHRILDFMAGSCTTGVAAIKRGCNPTCFELDEEKYHVGLSRMADVLNAKDAGKLELVGDNKG